MYGFDFVGWLFKQAEDKFMFEVVRKVRRCQLPRYLTQLAAGVQR